MKPLFTFLLLLLSGAAITLSFAPFNIWPISLISLTIFALQLKNETLSVCLKRSFIFGLGLYLGGVHWVYVSVHNFGGASVFLAALIVLIFALFLAFVFSLPFYILGKWFRDHPLNLIIVLPACWLLGEWLRSWLLTGFPWLYLGYGHLETWLSGWAAIGGVMSISFILVITAGVIAECILFFKKESSLSPSKTGIISSVVIVFGFWIAGYFLQNIVWAKPENTPITVGMVQPNLSQDIKLNWSEESVYQSLDQLREQSKDLWKNDWVIWPEAAIPTALTFHTALPFLEEVNSIASDNQASLFTGVIYDDADKNKYYNSVVGLGSGYGFYHKRRLVPFGEYVPLEDQLRGLIEFFNLPTSFIHLGPSEQHGLIAKGIRITPAICYEIVYPDLIAESAKETQVLLNINNLGWFLDSIQSKQFMQMAQMRALETGRYLVYSTNNGPSAIIDNKGKVLTQSQAFKADTLTGTIYPVKDWTPFMIIRSWPLVVLMLICLLGLGLFNKIQSQQQKRQQS
jgi:apolipoprotein N-acyltransferase